MNVCIHINKSTDEPERIDFRMLLKNIYLKYFNDRTFKLIVLWAHAELSKMRSDFCCNT